MKKLTFAAIAALSLSACTPLLGIIGEPPADTPPVSDEDYSQENCDLYGTCEPLDEQPE